MTKHTQTPWFKNGKFEIGPRPRTDDQHDGMLHPVADVFGDNREADAAFIVRAANAHDALVASLTEMVEIYWGAGDGQQPLPACIRRANDALAQANL